MQDTDAQNSFLLYTFLSGIASGGTKKLCFFVRAKMIGFEEEKLISKWYNM